MWESEFNNLSKYLRDFEPKKGVILVEIWAWTLCAEVVLAIQHLLGCCILGETNQRRSALVTKISQPRAWISLKRATLALFSHTLCAEAVLAIQHLLGCCILGETSQRRSAPVTKISQPRAWISLKRASVAPQSK